MPGSPRIGSAHPPSAVSTLEKGKGAGIRPVSIEGGNGVPPVSRVTLGVPGGFGAECAGRWERDEGGEGEEEGDWKRGRGFGLRQK